MNFLEFRRDPQCLGALPHMQIPETWRLWDVVFKGIDSLPMTDAELELWREHTGRERARPEGYREWLVRKGRQAGYSQIVADRATYKAATAPRDGSSAGTFVVILAQDSRAACRTIFSYVVRNFEASPMLEKCVVNKTADTITLDNGASISVYPCRPASLRGIRALAVYFDEFAHFLTTDNRPVDTEALRAAWPCRAMTGGELGIGSSPYAATGEFHRLDRANYATDSSTLVFAGTAPDFNPLLPADYLATLRAQDPEAAISEIDGGYRTGISNLFDAEVLEASTGDYRERMPTSGTVYRAFGDISGGQRDASAVSVAHAEQERIIVDAVRAWPAPHNPEQAIAEAAAFIKTYGCMSITGDRYAGQFPEQAFRRHGVWYEVSTLDRSALYRELLPRVLSGAVTIPNDPAVLKELRGLERRRGFGGRSDRIDHRGAGSHDDRANALAGAVWLIDKPKTGGGEATRIGYGSAGADPRYSSPTNLVPASPERCVSYRPYRHGDGPPQLPARLRRTR